MNLGRLRVLVGRWSAYAVVVLCVWVPFTICQQPRYPVAAPSTLPTINVGGGDSMTAQFARMDFAQMAMDEQSKNRKQAEKDRMSSQRLVESGAISALDLAAPAKAVKEYNQATSLLRGQRSQDAIGHLQKAIAVYPKFVSAHNGLGLAYLDLDDTERARIEFETAAKLDEKFPGSFLNLGRLALSQNDFVAAQSHLERAAAILPNDPVILSALAYAQYGTHQYQLAIQAAGRVHELPHKGMGNVHYLAAAAALALNEFGVVQRELALFLQEDPDNPLAPAARNNLSALAGNQRSAARAPGSVGQQPPIMLASNQPPSLPNSDRLKTQLLGIGDEAEGESCYDCAAATPLAELNQPTTQVAALDITAGPPPQWTIHKAVDEVALFFAVTSHGRTVSNLELSDIQIRDDNKPPEKVLQFTPQSKLPLRLGLLIDTSGSVQPRFSFEKHAASKFLQQMLNHDSDLAFVAGFAYAPKVTQDFTADHEKLASGINRLTNEGGTALFDAVSFACWKLAAYPERDRVAKVLIVVSDGEDNSSHSSLRQTIRDAEASGVTIYAISTKEGGGSKTDADRVLQALAERSGGEALFPDDMNTLGTSFDKLRDTIRSRYLIAYKPAGFEANGKYRTISIVAEKGGKRLQIHARSGYHARIEAKAP